MRVSTNLLQQLGVRAMLERQSELGRTQTQLATGRRLLSPADDPAGSATLLNTQELVAMTRQYQRNADLAEARLSIEEDTLAAAVDLLQRARELAIRGSNGTLNAGARDAIAGEVRQLLDQLLALANAEDANGEYLFAGFQVQTRPFTHDGSGTFAYFGDQGQRHVQIDATRQVVTGDSGADVFLDVPNSTENAFSTLYKLATDLEANNPDPAILGDIDAAMDSILVAQTRIGARLNTIDAQRNLNEGKLLHLEEVRSAIEDLDYAEAVSRFNLELTSLQAAQQSFLRIQGLSLFDLLSGS